MREVPKRGGKRTDEQPSREMPRREKGVVIEASGEAYTRSNRGRVVTVIPYAGPGVSCLAWREYWVLRGKRHSPWRAQMASFGKSINMSTYSWAGVGPALRPSLAMPPGWRAAPAEKNRPVDELVSAGNEEVPTRELNEVAHTMTALMSGVSRA